VVLAVDAAVLAATAVFVALALGLDTVVSFALAAYLVATAELVVLAEVLSIFDGIGRRGYSLAELLLLGVAVVLWVRSSRPPPRPSAPVRETVARHPVVLVLALVAVGAFAYQAFIAVATPPNNWDSMTYHLTRAAAWAQQGHIGYVAGAPTQRVNAFPPVAELQLLWTLVLDGRDTFAQLVQLVAEAALTLGVYGLGRRLGAARAPAAFAALLVPTLTVVALESVTTQNDVVVAAYVVAAAYFVLGATRSDAALAGVAIGLAIGTKVTALFALPWLVLLAVLLVPRRRLAELTVAALVGVLAFGAFVYVDNLAKTSKVFGRVDAETHQTPDVTAGGTVSTIARSYWRFVDASGYHPKTRWISRVGDVGRNIFEALHVPPNPPESTQTTFTYDVNVGVSEDVSFFGPLGILLVVPLILAALVAWGLGADRRIGLLALALPLYIVLVALTYRYNGWLGRFYITPVALTLPLAAALYQRRVVAGIVAAIAVVTLVLAEVYNAEKPTGRDGKPIVWHLSRPQAQALVHPSMERVLELDERLPSRVGAVLGPDDWSYPLYGRDLDRKVVYLRRSGALAQARRDGLATVVFGTGLAPRRVSHWTIRPLRPSGWAVAVRTG
jgi:dolichyl-phosphate-mannose-protein mannosyltransferase